MKYQTIPRHISEFSRVREQAIRIAFDLLGYCQRASKKKGILRGTRCFRGTSYLCTRRYNIDKRKNRELNLL